MKIAFHLFTLATAASFLNCGASLFGMQICACYDEGGNEIEKTKMIVVAGGAKPACSQEPVGQTTTATTTTQKTTTLDDHGFNAEQLAVAVAANFLPPCEAELQDTMGKKPKCDENGDYYPVQCDATSNTYYTRCWCVDIRSGAMRFNSYHNVLTSTITAALPDCYDCEQSIDHGKHCRINFDSHMNRDTIKQESQYGAETSLYKGNVAAQQPKIFNIWQPKPNPTPSPTVKQNHGFHHSNIHSHPHPHPHPHKHHFGMSEEVNTYIHRTPSNAVLPPTPKPINANPYGNTANGNIGNTFYQYPDTSYKKDSWLGSWGNIFGGR